MAKVYILTSEVKNQGGRSHGRRVPVGKVYLTPQQAAEAATELNDLLPGLRLEVGELDTNDSEALSPELADHLRRHPPGG